MIDNTDWLVGPWQASEKSLQQPFETTINTHYEINVSMLHFLTIPTYVRTTSIADRQTIVENIIINNYKKDRENSCGNA
jgi:hypothetical protein